MKTSAIDSVFPKLGDILTIPGYRHRITFRPSVHNIYMKGMVSQILNLGLGFYFMTQNGKLCAFFNIFIFIV